jgi:hypothetical protein
MRKRSTCGVDGCDIRAYKGGFCASHFKKPLSERFWAKVDKSGECWLWTAGTSRKGYGAILVEGKGRAAHRVAYELVNGPIPEGMQIDHMCHTRACVRPDHLRIANFKQQRENLSGPQSNSKSGIRGVSWASRQRRWKATVTHNRQFHHCGYFKTIEDAEQAVVTKRLELFTHNELDRKQAC